MAALLGTIVPLIRPSLGRSRFLIFLHTPLYMLHQFEEHSTGAFKAYVAKAFLRARGVNDITIGVINFDVWATNLAALYFARLDRWALSLLAPYIALVNGIIHVATALRERRYNPGLVTGIVLLLPLGVSSIVQVAREGRAKRGDHFKAAGGAVLLHWLAIALIMFAGKKRAQ
jgi:uncharacterized membrane protein HdeD (DUF308 family)